MLGRVGSAGFTRRPEAYNRHLVGVIRELALDRYDAGVHERLATLTTSVEIRTATAAAGGRLPAGDWEVRAAVNVAGFSHTRSVRRNGAPLVLTSAPPRLVARRNLLVPRRTLRRSGVPQGALTSWLRR